LQIIPPTKPVSYKIGNKTIEWAIVLNRRCMNFLANLETFTTNKLTKLSGISKN
jgi:hypothetical protein